MINIRSDTYVYTYLLRCYYLVHPLLQLNTYSFFCLQLKQPPKYDVKRPFLCGGRSLAAVLSFCAKTKNYFLYVRILYISTGYFLGSHHIFRGLDLPVILQATYCSITEYVVDVLKTLLHPVLDPELGRSSTCIPLL